MNNTKSNRFTQMNKALLAGILICICLLYKSGHSQAQGLNNQYKLDQDDVESNFELMGISNFKFPLTTDSQDVYLDFSVEVYNDTVLKDHNDYLVDIKKQVPKEYLSRMIYYLKMSRDTTFFKLSFLVGRTGTNKLKIKYNGFYETQEMDFDTAKFGILSERAFDYKNPGIGEKELVLVGYAKKKSEHMYHCPAGLKPEEIRKMYVYTIFVYIKPVRL